MEKRYLFIIVSCIFCFAAFAKPGDTMYVNVKESTLKSGTGFFSSKLENIYYGDAVVILIEEGKWTKIELKTNPAINGWISSANLTKKKILTGKTQNLSDSELALAGKGFSAEVEGAMKQRHGQLRFDLVDAIERKAVTDEELLQFLVEGNLFGGENETF